MFFSAAFIFSGTLTYITQNDAVDSIGMLGYSSWLALTSSVLSISTAVSLKYLAKSNPSLAGRVGETNTVMVTFPAGYNSSQMYSVPPPGGQLYNVPPPGGQTYPAPLPGGQIYPVPPPGVEMNANPPSYEEFVSGNCG